MASKKVRVGKIVLNNRVYERKKRKYTYTTSNERSFNITNGTLKQKVEFCKKEYREINNCKECLHYETCELLKAYKEEL